MKLRVEKWKAKIKRVTLGEIGKEKRKTEEEIKERQGRVRIREVNVWDEGVRER